MEENDGVCKTLFWLVVAITGAIIGYVRKYATRDAVKTIMGQVASISFAIFTSMFMACITYLAAKHYIDDHKLCVALAGIASYGGTDVLVACEKALLKKISGGEVPKRREDDVNDTDE